MTLAVASIGWLPSHMRETANPSVTPVVTPPVSNTTAPAANPAPGFHVSAATGDDSRTAAQAKSAITPWVHVYEHTGL